MNQESNKVVDQITSSLVMPMLGLTITQEEADAVKEYIRVRFEANIQGAVHAGFVRGKENQ